MLLLQVLATFRTPRAAGRGYVVALNGFLPKSLQVSVGTRWL
jgi:hypothetical protein